MNTGALVRGLVAMLAVAGVVGGAYAQEATGTPAQPGAAAAETEPTNPAQMLASAKAILPAMDRSALVVRRQLTAAREQKDVVKALCLNDKLNQIDLASRTATDRVGDLESAANANDVERARHQYTVVQVLKDRVSTLVSEANQCIGEETGFVGAIFALTIYLLVISKLIQIARQARDRTGMLFVGGFAALLLYHVTVSVGMVLRLLPIMGIPLPLMSYGGSSLMATYLGLGLALNVRLRRFVN